MEYRAPQIKDALDDVMKDISQFSVHYRFDYVPKDEVDEFLCKLQRKLRDAKSSIVEQERFDEETAAIEAGELPPEELEWEEDEQ